MKSALLLIIISIGLLAFAQEDASKSVLPENKQKIDSLEMILIQLESEIEAVKVNQKTTEKTMELAETTYQTAKEVFMWKDNWIFGGLAVISLIIAIISLLGVNWWIKNLVNHKVNVLAEKNTQELKRVITNERWGIDLRKRLKILILNIEGTNIKPEVEKIANEFKPEIINIQPGDKGLPFTDILEKKGKNIESNSFTIIILDDPIFDLFNDNGDVLLNFVRSKNIGILLYGGRQIKPDYHFKAFANNAYSLYNNLMQLMKFMDFYKN